MDDKYYKIDKYNDMFNNKIYEKIDNYKFDNYKIDNYKIENNGYIKTYGNSNLSKVIGCLDTASLNALRASLVALNNYSNNISTPTQATPVTPPIPIPVKQVVQQESVKPEDTNANMVLQQFMKDMFVSSKSGDFRGWILPNGELVSQFSNEQGNRQDHSKLIKLFIRGLQEFDPAAHEKVTALYDQYVANNYGGNDIYESFAVEALGWMQISEFGRKRLSCRGENWQNRYIGPFINGFGFSLNISDNGKCYDYMFPTMYDNTKQIFALGLEKTYAEAAGRAR